jgi:hypothetical protein
MPWRRARADWMSWRVTIDRILSEYFGNYMLK